MTAQTTRQVTGQLKAVDWNQLRSAWPHLAGVEFPQNGSYLYIDLLIALDMHLLHNCEEDELYGAPYEPVAHRTPLGWTCVGKLDDSREEPSTNFTFFQYPSAPSEDLIRRMWDIEEHPNDVYVKPEDKDAMRQLKDSLTYKNGRFCIGLPWIANKPEKNNFQGAKNRMMQLRRKLIGNKEMGQEYTKVIEEHEKNGYIASIKLTPEVIQRSWFVPHFAVIKLSRETTQYRVVFDAAARDGGKCLNDYLHTGPKLQQNLVFVLTRFRHHAVGVVCDISKMYSRIMLREDDQPYHSFLWQGVGREDVLIGYKHLSVMFGARPSPCMAQTTSIENAEQHTEELPRAAETVLSSTYMYDSMDSVDDEEEAVKLCEDVRRLWAYAGMNARKWLSNSARVMEQVPQEDCVKCVDVTANELPQIKTLGVLWRAEEDVFTFQIAPFEDNRNFTKRSYLSQMSTIFDPLGLISPVIIPGWDEELPEHVQDSARLWFSRLEALKAVQVPRALTEKGSIGSPMLHIFVDASLEAYGAVVYCRTEYDAPPAVLVRMVLSRARVTPLHSVSVPKLELMAAVVGVKSAEAVGRAMKITSENWRFWTDSLDVLYWIRGRSREFKPFVGNRVAVIQTRSVPANWQHVSTKINPADKLSRGVNADQLLEDELWWQGPAFLQEGEEHWPHHELETNVDVPEKRRKYNEGTFSAVVRRQEKPSRGMLGLQRTALDPGRYSDVQRLKRHTAYVLRFIHNCQSDVSKRVRGVLQPLELESALNVLIKYAQFEGFSKDWELIRRQENVSSSSVLAAMKPWMDTDGVIRSQSRLSQANYLPDCQKYPILMPRRHRITELIVKQYHENMAHGGTNKVMYALSEYYWIFSAREVIREVSGNCMLCKRRHAAMCGQQMAPLPAYRVDPTYQAFEICSVDLGGPYFTKQGRGKVRAKRYLCLFACVQVRAVHLEVAYGLDTSSFLNALNRMTARRGVPRVMISDNGTNFVSGDREMRELWATVKESEIEERTAGQGIKWEFNPPAAPHFNGLHESLIKSAKHIIRELVNASVLDDEVLGTVFCQAEQLLNSRPLTYQSSDHQDVKPLSPNHFLMGVTGKNLSPEQSDVGGKTLASKWRRLQQINRTFWERWIREWVSSLSGSSHSAI